MKNITKKEWKLILIALEAARETFGFTRGFKKEKDVNEKQFGALIVKVKEGIINKEEIIIYSTPSCHFCKDAKEFFNKNGVEYTEYDVSENMEKRKEMISRTGQMRVPVIAKDDYVVVGFKEDKLLKMLQD